LSEIFAIPTKLITYVGAYGIGILLGTIGFLITPNQQLPYISNISLLWILLPFFAVTEELVFRTLIYEEMSVSFGEGQAIAGTAVLFAALHVGPTVIPFVVSYFASFLLTLLYKHEHTIWTSLFANIFMKIVFLFLLLSITHTPLITFVP
jgi:membrane protease YdiL (CAAX protease family)